MNTSAPSINDTPNHDKLFTWSMATKVAAYAGVVIAFIAMMCGWFGQNWPTRMLGLALTIAIFVTPFLILMIGTERKIRRPWLSVVMALAIWGILGSLIVMSLLAL